MLAVNQCALLATLVVSAWQRNWPLDLPGFDPAGVPFEHTLPTARLTELAALAAVGAYALAGWPNRDRLAHGERRVFTLSLLSLLALAALSPQWAMHGGLAAVHAGHMAVWVAFALMMASGDWPVRRLAAFLLAGLLIHAAVGYLQIALQHFVGLGPRFGEAPVRPEETWASVVFAGPVRLLRAYGLSGHPNVLGGHLAVGLILSSGLLVAWPRIWRALIVVAWALVWVLLLVTFSRSAWLAIIAGALAAAALLWRARLVGRQTIRSALTLGSLAVVAGIIFVAIFRPFLINRTQPAAQPFETFSVAQREEMIDVAVQLIADRPLTGVGAANFSAASRTVTAQHYALDWVHNVPLLVTSELGLPGLAAFLAMIGSMIAVGARRWRSRSITLWQALTGGGLAALLAIMLFDHYLWTAPQGALLWALLAGGWMADPTLKG
jgi:O-antigen ligase